MLSRISGLALVVIGLLCAITFAQEAGSAAQRRSSSLQRTRNNPVANIPKSNKVIASALARPVVMVPSGAMPGGNTTESTLSGILRKQSMAARELLASSPVPTTSVSPLLGSNGRQMLSAGPATPNSAVPARVQPPSQVSGHVIPSQVCKAGIGAVDGQQSGVWFTPVSGPDGTFVIQGCGFGATAGSVSLSGVQTGPSANPNTRTRVSLAQNQVTFQVSPNQWSDRQIIAQIDANASGFYDTNNVTLVVKTSNGQQYQAAGFNFSAARQAVLLTALPEPQGCTAQSSGPACIPIGVSLKSVSSSNGAVQPQVESPSVSLLQSGETVAVARETVASQFPIPMTPGFSFQGGSDSYQFHFAPGFQLDPHTGVQLLHSNLNSSICQSVHGVYSNNGSWSVNYTSTSSFQVSWQEDACWPSSAESNGNPLDVLNYASLAAYALQITVVGPRGVSPWASGSSGTLPKGLSQPLHAALTSGQSSANSALLASNTSRGMLAAPGPAATQPSGNSQPGAGGMLAANPGAGGAGQLHPQPYSPSGTSLHTTSAGGNVQQNSLGSTPSPVSSPAIGGKGTLTNRVVAFNHNTLAPAYAGPCMDMHAPTSLLRLEFTTGKDDLRGGDNNLNVELHLKDNSLQTFPNVNKGKNWSNLSFNRVDIPLNSPVLADQIKEIHLVHDAHASFPNTEDNWEMLQFQVYARFQGKNENVANYGFNKFTANNAELTVPLGCAPAPGKVNALYFNVSTGSDDLRGDDINWYNGTLEDDSDNLNVSVGFSDGSHQDASNVNGGVNWPNNSTHHFLVFLNPPKDPSEIKSISFHTFGGNWWTDNWNLDSVQVTAIGNGVRQVIATHGFWRFTDRTNGVDLDMVTH